MDPKELCLNFVERTPERVTINASLRPDAKNYEIFFRSNHITLTRNTEALLSVGLLPAIKTGGTIVAEGLIRQSLLNSLDRISNFFCRLNSSLQRVPIKNVIPEQKKPPQENRVGAFFSGGIDSFTPSESIRRMLLP